MKISDFFKNEYVNHASYDNLRKIASLVDGQKNAARKILCTILEKNIREKVKVSQLGAKCSEFCITGDTLINTIEYGLISIEEIIKNNINDFTVLCFNEKTNEPIISKAKNPRITKYTDQLIEIQTENDIIKCTIDHKILIRKDTKNVWIEAQYLKENDIIVNI